MLNILDYFDIDWPAVIRASIGAAAMILFLIIAVKLINRAFKKVELKMVKSNKGSETVYLNFFRYVLLAVVYLLAFAGIAYNIPPLNKFMTTLLAGSGILAIVIGIASQDTLGNLAGGIMIVFSKPFKKGDIVRYVASDITGTIEQITLRHTIIKTFDNKNVIIPNSTINSAIVENSDYNSDSSICIFIEVSITYESDVNKALELLAQILGSHPSYKDTRSKSELEDGAPLVRVRVLSLADSGVILRGWLWADDAAIGAAAKGDVLLSILERFPAEGVSFAYPHCVIVHGDTNSVS